MTDSDQRWRWRVGNGLVSRELLPSNCPLQEVGVLKGDGGRQVVHPDFHTLMIIGEVGREDGSSRDGAPDGTS